MSACASTTQPIQEREARGHRRHHSRDARIIEPSFSDDTDSTGDKLKGERDHKEQHPIKNHSHRVIYNHVNGEKHDGKDHSLFNSKSTDINGIATCTPDRPESRLGRSVSNRKSYRSERSFTPPPSSRQRDKVKNRPNRYTSLGSTYDITPEPYDQAESRTVEDRSHFDRCEHDEHDPYNSSSSIYSVNGSPRTPRTEYQVIVPDNGPTSKSQYSEYNYHHDYSDGSSSPSDPRTQRQESNNYGIHRRKNSSGSSRRLDGERHRRDESKKFSDFEVPLLNDCRDHPRFSSRNAPYDLHRRPPLNDNSYQLRVAPSKNYPKQTHKDYGLQKWHGSPMENSNAYNNEHRHPQWNVRNISHNHQYPFSGGYPSSADSIISPNSHLVGRKYMQLQPSSPNDSRSNCHGYDGGHSQNVQQWNLPDGAYPSPNGHGNSYMANHRTVIQSNNRHFSSEEEFLNTGKDSVNSESKIEIPDNFQPPMGPQSGPRQKKREKKIVPSIITPSPTQGQDRSGARNNYCDDRIFSQPGQSIHPLNERFNYFGSKQHYEPNNINRFHVQGVGHSNHFDIGNDPSAMVQNSTKRVRRKCSVADCSNRVVQGGLCISHGARRKTCSHEGCTKNVKKAGLCSAHGPPRKRCEFSDCVKVAVQGGKCIAHGAQKKLCDVEDCKKQAIVSGMCKKHHDEMNGKSPSHKYQLYKKEKEWVNNINDEQMRCIVIGNPKDRASSGEFKSVYSPKKEGAKIIKTMEESSVQLDSPEDERSPKRHRRGLSLLSDVKMADTIIENKIL